MFRKYIVKVYNHNNVMEGYVKGDGKISGKDFNMTHNRNLAEKFTEREASIVIEDLSEKCPQYYFKREVFEGWIVKVCKPTCCGIQSYYLSYYNDKGEFGYSTSSKAAIRFHSMEVDSIANFLSCCEEKHHGDITFKPEKLKS